MAVLRSHHVTDEQYASVLAEMAFSEERAGNLSAAIAYLHEAVSKDTEQAAWRRALAAWHFRIGRAEEEAAHWEAAANAYRQAVALDDSRAWWHFRLGHVLDKAGEWSGAATALEEAVARDSSHPTWRERLLRAANKAPEWTLEKVPDPPTDPESLERAGAVAPPLKGVLTGWVPVLSRFDDRVVFKLNGVEVADTRATREVSTADGKRFLEFRRNLRDLWSYCDLGDSLTAEHAGKQLYFVESGYAYSFSGSEGSTEDLIGLLNTDYVFNKYGRVRQSIKVDEEWQSSIFELFERLQKEVQSGFGVQLFPFFGTMLGAVREQDFIGHDNDFDTIYISRHSTPEAVRSEFRELCAFLLDRGYDLRVKKTHTWVMVPGSSNKLDIFFSWFDGEDYFQTSYGHHGEPVKKSDAFFEFRTEKLGSREIAVPRNAEAILAQLYGANWREPDPGFTHFSRSRTIRTEFQLGIEEANEAHWRQFYKRNSLEGPSSFASFVATRLPAGSTIFDIGCGTGRDSVHFAALGHRIFAVDRSTEAITRAREASESAGVSGITFGVVDAASNQDVTRFVAKVLAGGDPADVLVVYLRFFLHSVDESTEENLIGGLVESVPTSIRLCAEFRTTQDGRLPKRYGDHYRRYIDEQRFAKKLRDAWGFEVEHLEAGQGYSPYGEEDPHLARIVALRTNTRRAG